jgi:hypothetical protein
MASLPHADLVKCTAAIGSSDGGVLGTAGARGSLHAKKRVPVRELGSPNRTRSQKAGFREQLSARRTVRALA